MVSCLGNERGMRHGADGVRVGTPGMKPAPRGRIHGGRRVAAEEEPLTLAFAVRVGRWDGAEQGLTVRMQGLRENLVGVPDFHDLTQVHDGNAMR